MKNKYTVEIQCLKNSKTSYIGNETNFHRKFNFIDIFLQKSLILAKEPMENK